MYKIGRPHPQWRRRTVAFVVICILGVAGVFGVFHYLKKSVEDCSVVQGDAVDIGILGSTRTATGTSQFSVGTNASSGYTVSVSGTTLTAGNEVIPNLTNQTASQRATAQFGFNLRLNSNPAIGEEPSGSGSGQPLPAYNTPNLFRFRSGDALATKGSTENYRRYTVSYIANVPVGQSPGVYATTLSYICLANF